MVAGGEDIGNLMVSEKGIPLVSFTGSTKIGRKVNEIVS